MTLVTPAGNREAGRWSPTVVWGRWYSLKDVLKIVVATAEEAPGDGPDDDIGVNPYAPFAENPVARDAWLRIATAVSSREPGSTPT